MTDHQIKYLSLFEKLFKGASPAALCDDEILNAKIALDASYVRNGIEDPDLTGYVSSLQNIKLKYE